MPPVIATPSRRDDHQRRRIGWTRKLPSVVSSGPCCAPGQRDEVEAAARTAPIAMHRAGREARRDLALQQAVDRDRADRDADREDGDEQAGDLLVGAEHILHQRREDDDQHRADRPEEADREDREEQPRDVHRRADQRDRGADDVPVDRHARSAAGGAGGTWRPASIAERRRMPTVAPPRHTAAVGSTSTPARIVPPRMAI